MNLASTEHVGIKLENATSTEVKPQSNNSAIAIPDDVKPLRAAIRGSSLKNTADGQDEERLTLPRRASLVQSRLKLKAVSHSCISFAEQDAPDHHHFSMAVPPVRATPNDDSGSTCPERANDQDEIPNRETSQIYHHIASVVTPGFLSQSASRSSFTTSTNAQEICETLFMKLLAMKNCILALVINSGLLWLTIMLSVGLPVQLSSRAVETFGPVVVEICLLISNLVTILAMDDALAIFFGRLFVSPQGYSLAICGFAQASTFSKWQFCSNLSLNSRARKFLSRLSLAWMLAEIFKLTTVITATSISYKEITQTSGSVDCIVYNQDGILSDREYPTFAYEQGLAELVFGSGLGVMRSEVAGVNVTTRWYRTAQFILQFMTLITSTTLVVSTSGFTRANVTASNVAAFYSLYHGQVTQGALSLISLVEHDDTAVYITSTMTGFPVCGGANSSQLSMVCSSTLFEHQFATLQMTYMSDGSSASSAMQAASVTEILGPANVTWLYQAMMAIMHGPLSALNLQPTIPGALSPVLWSINANLVEAGIETLLSILIRGGIQRTYSSHGSGCILSGNVAGVTVSLTSYGVRMAYCMFAIQLLLCLCCVVAFVPWLLSSSPISPGVRAVRDEAYFMTLLSGAGLLSGFGLFGNSPTYTIWQNLDVVARIGESMQTIEDEVGKISLDKVKLVRPLKNGRKYT
ncbi:hypothetical protein SmJEL517_g02827 [Synchytrium microbalum]|uniref:Transmembrane protein n=1 Tax=Synchytrium microbalum TaxID=1806994 RepID=A0A507CAE3_9FUNG|nr:uncharacterized protein SmJEL517_g02827 [Synchytrium microbalum]TPX34475.1 hypothetical protein SmJEL517_g02827 [Synchytrium microbalum]